MSAPALSAQALARLRRGVPALVLSADGGGWPHSSYTWAVAASAQCLRLAVDAGSTTGANLAAGGRGGLQVVGNSGLNLLICGTVRLLRARIAAAGPAAMELWELGVESVQDQSWPGVATSALAYRWPAEQRAALRRMERAVYLEMRAA